MTRATHECHEIPLSRIDKRRMCEYALLCKKNVKIEGRCQVDMDETCSLLGFHWWH